MWRLQPDQPKPNIQKGCSAAAVGGATEITPIASGVGLRIEAPESERFDPVARSSLCARALFLLLLAVHDLPATHSLFLLRSASIILFSSTFFSLPSLSLSQRLFPSPPSDLAIAVAIPTTNPTQKLNFAHKPDCLRPRTTRPTASATTTVVFTSSRPCARRIIACLELARDFSCPYRPSSPCGVGP